MEIQDKELSNIENRQTTIKKLKTSKWQDDHEKEIIIDISQKARLRKLRTNKDQTKISGVKYQEKIRNYYQENAQYNRFLSWANNQQNLKLQKHQPDTLKELIASSFAKVRNQSNEISGNLPEKIIDIKPYSFIRKQDRHKAVIQSLEFSENNKLLMTAGMDKIIKFFTFKNNRHLKRIDMKLEKSLFVKGLPLKQANFINSKQEVLACGSKKFMMLYNIKKDHMSKITSSFMTSNLQKSIESFKINKNETQIAISSQGPFIILLDAHNKQMIHQFRMNARCSDFVFTNNSSCLISSDMNGQLYQWDLKQRKIMDSFKDQGTYCTNKVAICPNDQYFATGHPTGNINIYKYNQKQNKIEQKVLKQIQNLTTSITDLSFNPTGQILLGASKWKRNNVKLINIPGLNVYQNWPHFKTIFKYPNAIDWSSCSSLLSIGNEEGNVNVFKINNFKQ